MLGDAYLSLHDWFSIEVVKFKGHPNIRATHKTTFEITKENYLTPRGDCIIGVSASKSLADFNDLFKKLVANDESVVIVVIAVEGGYHDIVLARGSSKLTYSDEVRIIARKSAYTSPNTACIYASKAAADLDRRLVNELRKGKEGIALFLVIK